jgi:prepilin-type N-terminal cleavage/methylation domain-containing protein
MMSAFRSERGYSLVEVLVSMAIMVTITGAIFSIVDPSRGAARSQPEFADMQQRARVGTEVLFKDLVMAGAGPYQGATTGSLMNFFAPVLPYRAGRELADPPGSFKPDAITIVYVPNTYSQTTIRDPMPNVSAEIKVEAQNNCPASDVLCGFTEGMSVLIFNPQTGSFDTFEITKVQSEALHLQHRGSVLSEAYPSGAVITQAAYHTYYFDAAQLQLRHYDGLFTDVPILDNVVGLRFDYFGDPNPPMAPRPPIGVANCVFDMSGNPLLPVLPGTGSLVPLDPAIFQDGLPAWCGAGSNRFDPDLLRIRRIRTTVRVQTGDAGLRGSDPQLFRRPGQVRGTAPFVPDYELQLDVTPRNLNLVR